jgi:hypothetical protein
VSGVQCVACDVALVALLYKLCRVGVPQWDAGTAGTAGRPAKVSGVAWGLAFVDVLASPYIAAVSTFRHADLRTALEPSNLAGNASCCTHLPAVVSLAVFVSFRFPPGVC